MSDLDIGTQATPKDDVKPAAQDAPAPVAAPEGAPPPEAPTAAKPKAQTPVKDNKPPREEGPAAVGPMNANPAQAGDFLAMLIEVIFGKGVLEGFQSMDPVRQQTKHIISAMVGDIEKIDMRGKDADTAMRETAAMIKKTMETQLEAKGMKFDDIHEKHEFMSKVDAALKAAVDEKTGNFKKEVFVNNMADEAKRLGVDITTRYGDSGPAAPASAPPVAAVAVPTAKSAEPVLAAGKAPDSAAKPAPQDDNPVPAAKPAGENIVLGAKAVVGADKMNFTDGEMTVYKMGPDGQLDVTGLMTPDELENKLGGSHHTVQTVSVDGERVGYFLSDKDGNGYIVGADAVKLAENPELAKTLAEQAPKAVEPSQKPQPALEQDQANKPPQYVANGSAPGLG